MKPEDVRLVHRLIPSVRLDDIRCMSGGFHTNIESPSEAGDAQIGVIPNTAVVAREVDAFVIAVQLRVEIPSRDPQQEPAVGVTADYHVRYSHASDLNPTDEELAAFGRCNALFNTWPYFREFVHAAMSRMELPPLLIPLLKMERRKTEHLKEIPSASTPQLPGPASPPAGADDAEKGGP